jgi:hypothetical protein
MTTFMITRGFPIGFMITLMITERDTCLGLGLGLGGGHQW